MNIITNWLFGVAVKKAVKKVVTLVIAYLSSAVAQKVMLTAGIHIDADQFSLYLTGAMFGMIEVVRNWAKHKFGWEWL